MSEPWNTIINYVGLKIIGDTFSFDLKKFPKWFANKFPFFIIAVFGLLYLFISKFRKPNPDANKVFIVIIIMLLFVVVYQQYLKAKDSKTSIA